MIRRSVATRQTETGSKPFVGPSPLQRRDGLFGRTEDLGALCEVLPSSRILMLHSPSGAGKSSIINAGVVPQMERHGFTVLQPLRAGGPESLKGAPGGRFIGNVLNQWNSRLPESKQKSHRELMGVKRLSDFARDVLDLQKAPFFLMIFDQFEEVATVDPAERKGVEDFFDQVGELLENRRIWALFAIREDYLGDIEPYADWIPTGLRNRQRLDLLTIEQASDAIEGPVKRFGVEFDPAVAKELVKRLSMRRDSGDRFVPGKHVEPVLLQVVCAEIWEALREDEKLIGASRIPGESEIAGALGNYFDRVVNAATTPEVPAPRIRSWVVEQMIDGNRRKQTLKGPTGTSADAAVLRSMIDDYLLREDVRNETVWYELVHDRLIEGVRESNLRWELQLPEDQQFLHQRANAWVAESRNDDLLLRGAKLAAARDWAGSRIDALPEPDREYLRKSIAARNQRRREKIWTVLAVGAIAALVIAAYLAIAQVRKQDSIARDIENRATKAQASIESASLQLNAANQRVTAANQKVIDLEKMARLLAAQSHRDLAAADVKLAAAAARANDADLQATQARLEAQTTRTDIARQKEDNVRLQEVLDLREKSLAEKSDSLNRTSLDLAQSKKEVALAQLALEAAGKLALPTFSGADAFSFSHRLADAEKDMLQDSGFVDTYGFETLKRTLTGSLSIWTSKDHEPVLAVGYDSKNNALVTGTASGRFRVYTLVPGSPTVKCVDYTEPIDRAIYDLKQQDCPPDLGNVPPQGSPVAREPSKSKADSSDKYRNRYWTPSAVGVGPAGKRVALGYYSGDIVTFDLPSGNVTLTKGFSRPVRLLDFNSDDTLLAGGTYDYEFAVIDPAGNRSFKGPGRWLRFNLRVFGNRSESASQFAFGERRTNLLAVGHDDGRVEVWDWKKQQRVLRLCGHDRQVSALAFTKDGSKLVSAAIDGRAVVWPIPQMLHNIRDRFLYPSTDVSSHCDGGLTSNVTSIDAQAPITAVTINEANTLMASVGQDNSLSIWDVSDPKLPVLTLPEPAIGISGVRFVSDHFLASTGSDGSTRLWDISSERIREISELCAAIDKMITASESRLSKPTDASRTLQLLDKILLLSNR